MRCGYEEGPLRVCCACGAIFNGSRRATCCLVCAARMLDVASPDALTYEELVDRVVDLSALVTEVARCRSGGVLDNGAVSSTPPPGAAGRDGGRSAARTPRGRPLVVSEARIERAVCAYARRTGWLVYKFTSPGQRSVPDRIFMRGGAVVLIEFKRPGARVPPAQEHEHARIRTIGGLTVNVVDDIVSGCAVLDTARLLRARA